MVFTTSKYDHNPRRNNDLFSGANSSSGRKNTYAGQGVTAHEFEMLREQKLQEGRAIDLEKADVQNEIKGVQLDTAYVQLDTEFVNLEIANINLQTRGLDAEIAQVGYEKRAIDYEIALQQLTQSDDLLVLEQFKTAVLREQHTIAAQTELVRLESAHQDLQELLSFQQLSRVEFQPEQAQLDFGEMPSK